MFRIICFEWFNQRWYVKYNYSDMKNNTVIYKTNDLIIDSYYKNKHYDVYYIR